jgi:hypothetical protein
MYLHIYIHIHLYVYTCKMLVDLIIGRAPKTLVILTSPVDTRAINDLRFKTKKLNMLEYDIGLGQNKCI